MPRSKIGVKQVQNVTNYRKVFNTPEGQRVLWDLMKAGHMLQTSYGRGADSHRMAFCEGERNIVIKILSILKTDPEELRELIEQGEDTYEQ